MGRESELGGEVLAAVSRSFYLSLKFLPKRLRSAISVGYLLARISDTVADAAGVDAGVRLRVLEEFGQWVSGSGGAADWFESVVREEVLPGVEDAGERVILERVGEAVAWMRTLEAWEQGEVREVLGHILRGQRGDVERFPDGERVRCLGSAEETDAYTFDVAGCVGVFWTRLCEGALGKFRREGVSVEEMEGLGVRYGKGLQLVNILRDLPRDLSEGRCYLPEGEMREVGVDLERWEESGEAIRGVMRKWEEKCGEHLEAGMGYLRAVRSRRVLFATALPLMLGVQTLARIREADWGALQERVKVGRGDVKSIMARTTAAVVMPGRLEKLYEALKS